MILPTIDPRPWKLTGGEAATLAALCGGLDKDGMAEALRLSPRSVHTTLTRLYSRVGVSGHSAAVQCVAMAYRHGVARWGGQQ